MALNLWTTGGGKSSYNPLPTGGGNYVSITNYVTTFNVTFYASSATSARLKVRDTSGTVSQYINLTPYRTAYSVSLVPSAGSNSIAIVDDGAIGNIVIDSIKLVQAPLKQLTINGVDGFLSGKWSIDPNAKVQDDQTLILNAPYAWASSSVGNIPILPNQPYAFSGFVSSNGSALAGFLVNWLDKNGTLINSGGTWACTTTSTSINFISGTLTSPSNAVTLRVLCTSNNSGTFVFNKFIVNLGSIPAPYSKKTGDTMVLPTAKKNLVWNSIFSNFGANRLTFTDTGDGYMKVVQNQTATTDNYLAYTGQLTLGSFNTVPVLPNTTYTGSIIARSDGNCAMYLRLIEIGAGGTVINDHVEPYQYNTTDTTLKATWKTDPRTLGMLIRVQFPSNVIGYTAWVKQNSLQLELGSATPYSPYNVQMNKAPKRLIPKKNLFDGGYLFNYWNAMNTIDTLNADGSFTIQNNNYGTPRAISPSFPASWGGKTVTFSVDVNSISGGQTYRLSIYDTKQPAYLVTPTFTTTGRQSLTCTLPADCTGCQFWIHPDIATSTASITVANAQVEFSSVPTLYEPYIPVLPPSNTGLKFNGVSDYVEIPFTSNLLPNQFSYVFDVVATVNSGTEQMVYCKDFSATGKSGGTVYNKIGIINGKIRFTVSTTTSSTTDVNGNILIADGIKHHVVCSYDGSAMKIFVDGVLDAQSSKSGAINYGTPDTNPRIASRNNGVANSCLNCVLYNFSFLDGNGYKLVNYDFTNPNTIAGNTVFSTPAPQNLIPSFEDPRWKLSGGTNSQILGKDIWRQTASGAFLGNLITLPVTGGATYFVSLNSMTPNARLIYELYDSTGTVIGTWNSCLQFPTLSKSITVNSNAASILIKLDCLNSGTFDYIRPQLYQLDGKQGTISGSPVPAMKTSKRLLYNLR